MTNISSLISKFENLSTKQIKYSNNNSWRLVTKNNCIFFKVWRNIVTNRIIFKYIRLYNKNKVVKLKGIDELRNYGEREFITELKYIDYSYRGDKLSKGDLPEYCVLKVIDLSIYCYPIDPTVIPSTVETIHYNGDYNDVQFSEFPSTVTEITNVSPREPYSNNPIPNNITSISFYGYIDPCEFYTLKLPNSIKKLDILILGYINKDQLTVPPDSFIPSSVTDLSISYDESYKPFLPQIPITCNNLVTLLFQIHGSCNFQKGIIPFGVVDLTIDGVDNSQFILSVGTLPLSISKLSIYCNSIDQILPSSIPNTVLHLYIKFQKFPNTTNSLYNIFPKSLTKLELDQKEEDIQFDKLLIPSNLLKLIICGNDIKIK